MAKVKRDFIDQPSEPTPTKERYRSEQIQQIKALKETLKKLADEHK